MNYMNRHNQFDSQNKTDSQIIIEEIHSLKERLNTIKKEKITKENINLFQQLDEELTNKLLRYILVVLDH